MNLKNTYYLVRHGESASNISQRNDSHGDPNNHLSSKGVAETEACAKNLARQNIVFEKIISSPFLRTKESAEIFLKHAHVHDKEILYTPLLKEMNHGSEMFGQVMVRPTQRGTAYEELHNPHGDGECFWDVRERMLELIRELEGRYTDKTLLLVTHGSPIWMFYSAARGLNEEETAAFRVKREAEKGFFIRNADPLLIN